MSKWCCVMEWMCCLAFSLSACSVQIYGADFVEVSAKTGYNVGSACLTIVRWEDWVVMFCYHGLLERGPPLQQNVRRLCCERSCLPSLPHIGGYCRKERKVRRRGKICLTVKTVTRNALASRQSPSSPSSSFSPQFSPSLSLNVYLFALNHTMQTKFLND